MRKFTAIVLLLLFASTNEVGQLLKLPFLVLHYIDHYKEEGQSIAAFFHEHYIHHHSKSNKDEQEDNRLPFKTTTIEQASFTYLLPLMELVNKPAKITGEKRQTLLSSHLPPNHLKDIFHPPQIV